MLTIGAFARAARLSPKALRLYDDLGLLPPAAVDSDNGYRYYRPEQLETARLIAWLRRLGMPLARIREVAALEADAAAEAVRAYRAEVVAEAAHREQLATLLVDYLTGRSRAMPTIQIRYAARTDRGAVRPSNPDTAYASDQLLAVADGAGAKGEDASAAAIGALRALTTRALPGGELLGALAEAAEDADRAVAGVAESTQESKTITTLTAMLWSGSQLALVHIGDTRAYRLRGGDLFQITHDHTYVQTLVDSGQLIPEEAASHPEAMLLVRALTGAGTYQPDLSVHDAEPGDRYLLCSDGLSRVVPAEAIRDTLVAAADPDAAVAALIERVHAAGAPDNIACVVADVLAA
jgi:protein phosphatase